MAKFKTNQTLVNNGFNQASGGTLTLSGNTTIASSGTFEYLTDRSIYFDVTPRAVPDVAYVSGLTTNIRNIGLNQQIIYRDVSGITGATDFIYDKATSGVTVPNLCISQTPPSPTGNYFLLTWDSGTTKVSKTPALCITGLIGACNGLSTAGSYAILGGDLICNTSISGVHNYSLLFEDLSSVCIKTISGDIILDSRCDFGGIYLKSRSNSFASPPVDNYSCAIGIAIDYQSNIFNVYDNRIGANQRGIEYNADYSTFYTQRSLVDKAFVEAVAAGIQPKAAVIVATTEDIELSGLTAPVIIDGITLNNGDRVLIKDQINAKNNGIYELTGTTGNSYFIRTADFNTGTIPPIGQGVYTFVLSGNTLNNTSWVLSTPNPISIGVTPLTFTLYNRVTGIIAGTGITTTNNYGQFTISVDGASLAGNYIIWSGNTFNIDEYAITSGYTTLTQFDNYTGITENRLIDIETWSGETQPIINGALTGVTYVGNGVVPYSGISEREIIFNTFIGSGDTTVQKVDDEIIIHSALNVLNVIDVIGTGYTATTSNDFIGVSGGTTIMLPFLPKNGQRIIVADIAGNASIYPIKIAGNGKEILRSTDQAIINTDYGSITFIFNSKGFWSMAAFIN